jgi:hypothetical protein
VSTEATSEARIDDVVSVACLILNSCSPLDVNKVGIYSVGGFAFNKVDTDDAGRRVGQLQVIGPLKVSEDSIKMVSSGSVEQNS